MRPQKTKLAERAEQFLLPRKMTDQRLCAANVLTGEIRGRLFAQSHGMSQAMVPDPMPRRLRIMHYLERPLIAQLLADNEKRGSNVALCQRIQDTLRDAGRRAVIECDRDPFHAVILDRACSRGATPGISGRDGWREMPLGGCVVMERLPNCFAI
jgi:hypothetical protein